MIGLAGRVRVPENTLYFIFARDITGFKRFEKGQTKGTGMGLSVVHGIITRMDGSIDVATTPGKGTIFRLRIPAAGTGKQPAGRAGKL